MTRPVQRNAFQEAIHVAQGAVSDVWEEQHDTIMTAVYWILFVAYLAYFVYAMYYEFGSEASVRLLWMTCCLVFGVAFYFFWKYCGESVTASLEPAGEVFNKHGNVISW